MTLTEQNAFFVTRLPDNRSFRFHHMMKECTERAFVTLEKGKQRRYRNRYGAWYEGRALVSACAEVLLEKPRL